MLFNKELSHLHAVRHALLRGATLVYLIFGSISFLLALGYDRWLPLLFAGLFLLGAGLFWQCSRWLARGVHPLLAVRLSTGCLLIVTTVYALAAVPELPAPGGIVYLLVLLFSCLADTRRSAWLVCAICIALYVSTLWLRLHWFNFPADDPNLLLTLYLFTPMLFLLFTFIATDLNSYLRSAFRTSATLHEDLQSRTLEFQTLVETMNEGFVVIDEHDLFQFVNSKFCEMVGLTPGELLGRSYFDFSALDPANERIIRQQRALRTQHQRSTYELMVTRPDGQRMTLLISAIPNLGAEGEFRGASCVVLDITARKEAEAALIAERALLSQRVEERTAELARQLAERQQTEQEYRLLFNQAPIAIYRSSLDGRQLRANPALVKLNGYESEAEMLAAVRDIATEWYVDPNRRGEFQQMLAAHGQVTNFESEIYRHKTRERIWISESAVLIYDAAGKPLFYQGTVEDITARKTVELQQERLIQELARVAQMKDEFLASVSHELRTPLNGILNLTELLRDQIYGPLNGRQERALATVEESGRHLLSLINDLLDLARMGAGQVELTLTPVALNALCQASIKVVQTAAQKKKLHIYFTPDAAVETLLADELRLKQILINLLNNAVKFTPERGAIGLEILGQPTPAPTVQIVVWDTGIGIPPEAQEQIFRPFVQIDSGLARQHEGTGLGLALVQRMVEMHGGSVSVESQLQRGSRFVVTLPWRVGTAGEEPVATLTEPPLLVNGGMESVPAEPSVPLAAAPPVWLVAQEPGTIQMIVDYFHFKHFQTTVLPSLEQLAEHPRHPLPLAIIVDLLPPLDDGRAAWATLQADAQLAQIPLIVLTSRSPSELPPTVVSTPVIYLTKPVSLHQLVDVIQQQGVPA
jgi:PAS domain S-box-containing protein